MSEHLVEASNVEDELPTSKQLIQIARHRFDEQLKFAKAHFDADYTLDIKKPGEAFALLKGVENLTSDDVDKAWSEVEQAIKTLYKLDQAKQVIKTAELAISQCVLQYKLSEKTTVKAIPDLLAFSTGQQPTIVDWKVHAQGTHDAWLQLAVYAIALERCKPHYNWATYRPSQGFDRSKIRLFEVQLLTNVVREHVLDDEHFAQAEEFINSSSYEMACLVDGRAIKDLALEDFDVARFPETCASCNYQPFCWRTGDAN